MWEPMLQKLLISSELLGISLTLSVSTTIKTYLEYEWGLGYEYETFSNNRSKRSWQGHR